MSHRSDPLPLTGVRRRVAIASVLFAMAAAVLDASSVNIALPAIAAALDVAPAAAAWLVIAYQGALVTSLLPLAAVGERYGYRPTFVAGAALFGLCALGSAVAPDFASLLVLRALQGMGAGAVMALGVALLRQIVAPGDLGRAIGWNAMTVASMSAAAPTIGATLLSLGTWRFIFAGSAALTLLALAASIALPAVVSGKRALDRGGMALYVATIAAFLAAGGLAASPAGRALLLVAGTLGALFLLGRDRRRTSPFLPLDLFGNAAFRLSVCASIVCFAGVSLALLIMPFALQARLGASPFETAMLMTPWPLSVLLTTPLTTRLIERVEAARLCAAGGIGLSVGLAILAAASPASGAPLHLAGIILCGVGFGLFQTPNNRTMFLAAPVDRAASAGGVQGTARLTGQASGAILASSLLSLRAVPVASVVAFSIAAAGTLAAAAISMRRADRSAQ